MHELLSSFCDVISYSGHIFSASEFLEQLKWLRVIFCGMCLLKWQFHLPVDISGGVREIALPSQPLPGAEQAFLLQSWWPAIIGGAFSGSGGCAENAPPKIKSSPPKLDKNTHFILLMPRRGREQPQNNVASSRRGRTCQPHFGDPTQEKVTKILSHLWDAIRAKTTAGEQFARLGNQTISWLDCNSYHSYRIRTICIT